MKKFKRTLERVILDLEDFRDYCKLDSDKRVVAKCINTLRKDIIQLDEDDCDVSM